MEKERQNAVINQRAAFFALVNHPVKFKLYLLKNLPAAFFSGIKIVKADEQSCTVYIPYKAFTKNPFRSTYFACLSMAAEMSTGILAMASVYNRRTSVSMLITGMEAKFYKKATEPTFFTCHEGEKISETVSSCLALNLSQEISVQSTGKNKAGELVAEFWLTWSFKPR